VEFILGIPRKCSPSTPAKPPLQSSHSAAKVLADQLAQVPKDFKVQNDDAEATVEQLLAQDDPIAAT